MKTEELLALGMFGRGSRIGQRVGMLLQRGREFSARVSRRAFAMGTAIMAACLAASSVAPRLFALAQQTRFEVTSVKPDISTQRRWSYGLPRGGYKATNVTLHQLILNTYRVFDFQLEGDSGWMDTDRFDVEGKSAGTPDRAQVLAMARLLLADRFKLTMHRETRQLAVYEMTVAKGGIKLKEGKCVGEPGALNPCGGTGLSARGDLKGVAETTAGLAYALSPYLGRVVVDRTGLSATYDFELHWTPDESMPRGPGDPGTPPPDPNGPSLFTAMREQLGLELKSAKGPVEILVVDHAEKPDSN